MTSKPLIYNDKTEIIESEEFGMKVIKYKMHPVYPRRQKPNLKINITFENLPF